MKISVDAGIELCKMTVYDYRSTVTDSCRCSILRIIPAYNHMWHISRRYDVCQATAKCWTLLLVTFMGFDKYTIQVNYSISQNIYTGVLKYLLWFAQAIHGRFTGAKEIVRLSHWQWNNPECYRGDKSQTTFITIYITTAKQIITNLYIVWYTLYKS